MKFRNVLYNVHIEYRTHNYTHNTCTRAFRRLIDTRNKQPSFISIKYKTNAKSTGNSANIPNNLTN